MEGDKRHIMISNVTTNVERFVRWVYPGLLLMALIHFTNPKGALGALHLAGETSAALRGFALTAAVIIASFIIYTVYRYFFHQIVLYVFFVIGFSDLRVFANNAGLKGSRGPCRFIRSNDQFDLVVRSDTRFERYIGFSDYVYSLSHGLGMTWLMLFLWFWIVPSSRIEDKINASLIAPVNAWWIVGLLFVTWLLINIRNTDRSILFARSLPSVSIDSLWGP